MTDTLRRFWRDKQVLVLSGGVGGAKLVHGLARTLPDTSLQIAVNTGDDFDWMGLRICPDLDTILYTLSERAPVDRGWGIQNDTFRLLDALRELGGPDWFMLGDQDLAVHLLRTHALQSGRSLTEVTAQLFHAHALKTRVIPMADTPQATIIEDDQGRQHSFQDWLVKLRAKPVVHRVIFNGNHIPSDALLQAIDAADLVILPPSNPFVSLDPIFALTGVRDLLRTKPVIGVAPIVHGEAIKGPLAEMIPALLNQTSSACALAEYYEDLLDLYVVAPGEERTDRSVPLIARDIVMMDIAARDRLAREVLDLARTHNLVGYTAS